MESSDLYLSTAMCQTKGYVDVFLQYKEITINLGHLNEAEILQLETSLQDMLNEVIWRKELIQSY